MGASVAPDVPAGRASADLFAGQAFIIAVVVFRDERVDDQVALGQREGSCLGGAVGGAGDHHRALTAQKVFEERR